MFKAVVLLHNLTNFNGWKLKQIQSEISFSDKCAIFNQNGQQFHAIMNYQIHSFNNFLPYSGLQCINPTTFSLAPVPALPPSPRPPTQHTVQGSLLNHTIAFSFNSAAHSACIVFVWPRLHLVESSVADLLHQASSWMWLETHTGICCWPQTRAVLLDCSSSLHFFVHSLLFLMCFLYFAMSQASNLSIPSYSSFEYFASYFLEKPKAAGNE